MNNGKLDEIDKSILNVLQREGRIETLELSKRVNLSRTPVSLRLEKLLESRVIRGFAALLDREKAGWPVLVVTHVKLEKQTTLLLTEFEEQACTMTEVQACFHVSGDWNFILLVAARTPQAYFTFLMGQINSLPNVAHTDSAFVMKEAKIQGPLPI
ncbi:Lrp/AsnC family transcriptional regulator [Mucilaginibacter sp. AK015]|uniref:Lrp/AsnC family transcriptional regulator n=1 Tax=Mucilaginibacter sp. AK015 TaxID=2723072 RepID=UPI001613274D|nr:Lrp/AsnC family transcriptional regulator [Mucilaginibacter sp. AK015]MBB5396674.1 Lrp/AsnC family leucine-responsive transcriptional regulator [Mucilaginibacter sp. AK015]